MANLNHYIFSTTVPMAIKLGRTVTYLHFLMVNLSLPNGEYSIFLIVVAFSDKSFSSKTTFYVKSLYLPLFPDDTARILAVCLSESY